MNVNPWERQRAQAVADAMRDVVTQGVTGADIVPPLVVPADALPAGVDSQARVAAYGMLAGLNIMEPWQSLTLLNSFDNFGGIYTVQCLKDPFGQVKCRGLFFRSLAALNTTVLVFPTGYRPTTPKFFSVMADDRFARVDVQPTGELTVVAADSASWFNYISMDQISFPTN